MSNRILRKYLSKRIILAWFFGIFLGLIGGILQIYLPNLIKEFVNSAIKLNFQGVNITNVIRLLLLLLIVSSGSSFLIGYAGERSMFDLRNSIFKRILKVNPDEINMPVSEISNRLTNDAEVFGKYLSATIPNLIKSGLVFLGSLTSLMLLNWKLTLSLFILLSVFFLVINIFGHFIAQMGNLFKKESARYIGMLINHLNNWSIIKVSKAEEYANNRQRESAKNLFNVSFKAIVCETLAMPIQFIFLILMGLALFFVIAKQVQEGSINMGDITAIFLYLVNIINSANELSENFFDFQQDRGQLEGLRKLSQNLGNISQKDYEVIKDNKYCIRVSEASMNIEGKEIFSGITKDFKFRHYYLINGENGTGKTTFIMALLKLKQLTTGKIVFSNYARLSYVPQKPSFFIGSITDNLTLGRSISTEKIIEILKRVNLWNDLQNIHDGLSYVLDEKHSLSGGQLQKLAIARALLHNANVLILDEVTSNLDINSKRKIRDLIARLSNEITIIEITHDDINLNYAEKLNLNEY